MTTDAPLTLNCPMCGEELVAQSTGGSHSALNGPAYMTTYYECHPDGLRIVVTREAPPMSREDYEAARRFFDSRGDR